MSAEVLRRAAALMRERAEAATEGEWFVAHIPESAVPSPHAIDRWYVMGFFDGDTRKPTGPSAMCEYEPDAVHIASWHPAVALAVAEWLEAKAEQDDKGTCDDPRGCCNLCEHDYGHVAALAVARAYLGESS